MRKLLVLAILVFSCAGCYTGIRPDAIDGLVRKVSERHDAMLNGTLDPKTISPEDKATFLRSTQLLNAVVDEAKK